ncbi:filamentous hemagglutinin N-terminal domain-containing protein [Utexia brackfieldae]|uniref:two-partner secretion domain-containing protein n=1 Tax=Utexia brackfieldae TaxID=3074108 RepID=UPI00370D4BF0
MNKKYYKVFNPIVISLLLPLSHATYANVIINNGSSSNVRGVQVVNINTPNANGLSHNVYSKFDVDPQGVILNNSQIGAVTQIADQIMGNANLRNGTAKVILNEVNSGFYSRIRGTVEVAGTKANVIIANPSGIICGGCRFINANNVTLSTGFVDTQNNKLNGYSVSRGDITISDSGLSTDSTLALHGQTVNITGVIKAKDIYVVAGNNYVDLNNKITQTLNPTSKNSNFYYNIDISELGGMYANKIILLSNQDKKGIRNQGQIEAGGAGLDIDSKYRLINTGNIKSIGSINANVYYQLTNTGGKITSNQNIKLVLNGLGTLANSNNALISADGNLDINSGTVTNIDSQLSSGNQMTINTNNGYLKNSGEKSQANIRGGNINIQTAKGALRNNNATIQGMNVNIDAATVDNIVGSINAGNNVTISANGKINNNGGLIRAQFGRVKLSSINGFITNNNTIQNNVQLNGPNESVRGIIAGSSSGGIDITTGSASTGFTNANGQTISQGDINLQIQNSVYNQNGKLQANKKLQIKANSLNNSQGSISAKGGILFDINNIY